MSFFLKSDHNGFYPINISINAYKTTERNYT